MKTLIIGLGRVGVLVARRAKKMSELLGSKLAPVQYLAIDQDEDALRGNQGAGFASLAWHEMLQLSAKEARVVLARRNDWGKELNWLPDSLGSRTWDDLEEGSAGGYRYLGRLSLFARNEVALDLLQQALASLRAVEPQGDARCRIAFVAALGGGTGSGILMDLTYFAKRCRDDSSRLAYLLLPSHLEPVSNRSLGNAYAALREIQNLKYQAVAFEACYPRVSRLQARKGTEEPWERIFLFQTAGSDLASLDTAIERMARSLISQLYRRLQVEIAQDNNRKFHIGGESPQELANGTFSACGALWSAYGPPIARPASPIEMSESSISDMVTAERSEKPLEASNRWFRMQIDHPLCQGRDKLIKEMYDKLTLRSRQAEQGNFHNLEELQQSVDKIVSIIESPSTPNSEEQFLINEEALAALDLFGEVKHDLEVRVQEYLDKGGETWRAEHPEAETPAEKPETNSSKEINERLAKHLTDLDHDNQECKSFRKRAGVARWWYAKEGLEIVRQRCADMLEVVENPRFREAIKNILTPLAIALLDSNANKSHAWPTSIGGTRTTGSLGQLIVTQACGPSPMKNRDEWRSFIDKAAEECGTSVFSQSTANEGHHRHAIALLPESMIVEGNEQTEASVTAALNRPCRIVRHAAEELLFYFEDIFHPAHEIEHLEEMKEAYIRERSPELFHVDKRFLYDPLFTELCDDDNPSAILCGNSGCRETLACTQRDIIVCPGCHLPIRSRCGNLSCRLDDLHTRTDSKAKSCPGCGGFNHAAWWQCYQHEKNPIAVPIDKERCPDCIRRHQDDSIRFPSEAIGVRPDMAVIACPGCLISVQKDHLHQIFYVRGDLLPFYLNGVNGHDSERMAQLVEEHRLLERFRCPNCQTHLIPVDHRGIPKGHQASPSSAEGTPHLS